MSALTLTPIQLDALAVIFSNKRVDTGPHLGPSVAGAVRRLGIDPSALIPSLLQAVCEQESAKRGRTTEPSKLFGKEMVLQALPGKPLCVLSLDGGDMCVSIWLRDNEWVCRAELASKCLVSSTHPALLGALHEAARVIESRILELVEVLGPLAGWRPPT